MSIAFFLNVDDWLSSSEVLAMSGDEERGYMRLLMHQWKALVQTGRGLPDREVDLARWACVSLRRWRKGFGERLRRCFTVVDGFLFNDRLQREYENYKLKQQSAVKAGRARWDRAKDQRPPQKRPGFEAAASILDRMPAASESHAPRMRPQCAPDATSYNDTSYITKAASVEARECVADAPSLPNDGAAAAEAEGEGMMPNNEELKQGQELLKDLAKRTAMQPEQWRPDLKITAQILIASGGLAALIPHLVELQQRDLRSVSSHGYFLRAIQARLQARAG